MPRKKKDIDSNVLPLEGPGEGIKDKIKVRKPRPLGTGSKYRDEYPEDLVYMMEQGMLDCEIYAEWSIEKDTFYRWRREKPELEHAFNIGLPKCEAWWTRKMRECFLKGDDKGFKYCIAIMNNKFGWERGAKQLEGTTNNISIGNINVLQQKDRAGLLEHIQNLVTKHKDIIDVELIEHTEPGDTSDENIG